MSGWGTASSSNNSPRTVPTKATPTTAPTKTGPKGWGTTSSPARISSTTPTGSDSNLNNRAPTNTTPSSNAPSRSGSSTGGWGNAQRSPNGGNTGNSRYKKKLLQITTVSCNNYFNFSQ